MFFDELAGEPGVEFLSKRVVEVTMGTWCMVTGNPVGGVAMVKWLKSIIAAVRGDDYVRLTFDEATFTMMIERVPRR